MTAWPSKASCGHKSLLPVAFKEGAFDPTVCEALGFSVEPGAWSLGMCRIYEAIVYCEVIVAAAAKLRQSCPTLCDPIDGSPPGSPIPGILQARTLEWDAIAFSNA